ncbi:MAG: DUF1501 domain-containing protein [Planctomycetaceae bacterium]|nr:DUF1501 domain-containing protein [Planctomycetaceae bacterium]
MKFSSGLPRRRSFCQVAGLNLLGASASGWFPRLAARAAASETTQKRKCILLWMSGGPSQMETFDPKPEQENGGPTLAIDTAVSGIRISENLPQTAAAANHLAIVRSMTTKEGDHARATYFMHTGYLPHGPVRYPTMGSFVGMRLKNSDCDLPAYISINPFRAFSPEAYAPGFLGPSWSPLVVESQTTGTGATAGISFEVSNLQTSRRVAPEQADARMQLLAGLEHDFLKDRPDTPGRSHLESYQQAVRMMKSSAVRAFDIDQEPDVLREAYGRNPFGQGCLLARRLIESGVSFVEVNLSGVDGSGGGAGWDTHQDNFSAVKSLCGVLDPAYSSLITDLNDRGLLQDTLVIWMGEFGRTPKINDNTGRDHWPKSWSTVLAGGGIRGGQAFGCTSDDGSEITDNPVTAQNLIATICAAVGLDHDATNMSNIGRPIPLADHGSEPVTALLS